MRGLAAFLAGLLVSGAALAADGADFDPIGYSPDSRYFAFEQFGIEDGSGFPFWDIFVIDLKADAWVKGTPIHVRIDREEAPITEARAKAREAAIPVLQELDVSMPAVLLAANPATEVVADRSRISFDRWYVPMGSRSDGKGLDGIRHSLSVDPVALPNPADCPAEDGATVGFKLTITDETMGISRELHADTAIPASRNCPYSYDLAAVVAPAGYPVTDRLVAIIGVYSRGFEGADHRFITVPFTISD